MIILDEFLDFLDYDPFSYLYYPFIQNEDGSIFYGVEISQMKYPFIDKKNVIGESKSIHADLFVCFNGFSGIKTKFMPVKSTRLDFDKSIRYGLKLRSDAGIHSYIINKDIKKDVFNDACEEAKGKERKELFSQVCNRLDAKYRYLDSNISLWSKYCTLIKSIPTKDELLAIKTIYDFKMMDEPEIDNLPF